MGPATQTIPELSASTQGKQRSTDFITSGTEPHSITTIPGAPGVTKLTANSGGFQVSGHWSFKNK